MCNTYIIVIQGYSKQKGPATPQGSVRCGREVLGALKGRSEESGQEQYWHEREAPRRGCEKHVADGDDIL